MKILFTSLLVLAASLLTPQLGSKAFAQSTFYGTSVRIVFSSTNIGATDWVPVIASLPRSIGCLTASNGSSLPLQLGSASAGSVANSEVQRMIVPASSTGSICYPLQVSAGMRVSIRTFSSTANTGEGQFNFFYN